MGPFQLSPLHMYEPAWYLRGTRDEPTMPKTSEPRQSPGLRLTALPGTHIGGIGWVAEVERRISYPIGGGCEEIRW